MNSNSSNLPVMRSKEWLLLLLLSVLWGGSFFFSEIALRELLPFTVVLMRVSIAAIALHLIVYLRGQRMPSSAAFWRSVWVMGMLNNFIPFSLIVWGQTQIDSSLAAILNATTPLFSVVLAHLLTPDEPLTGNRLLGIGLGFMGVVVLMGPEVLQGLSLHGLGQVAVLAAALSYALAGIYGRRFQGIAPIVTATGMVTTSAVMLLPLALTLDHPWTAKPIGPTWVALFGLGLLCTALAYLLYFQILAVAGATNLLLVTFLIPISALLLGTIGLGERLHWNALAGMGLVLAGLVAIDGRIAVGHLPFRGR